MILKRAEQITERGTVVIVDNEMVEPVKINLDPETALSGLLKVDPESEPVPDLDTYVWNSPLGREWQISCRSCGWIADTGESPEAATEAARTHRCQPEREELPAK